MAKLAAASGYNNPMTIPSPITTTSPITTLTPTLCRKARLARDARYDGLFYVAVKTTGIFCRPVCPAVPPKEENVEYFPQAQQAARAGYRPCFRCRPDSAPNSCAWQGTATTLQRALQLIDSGALEEQSLPALAERLGIGERYLRKLFDEHLGISPKAYALFRQVMFAKQLLHESALPIGEVAVAAGFGSVRRFNDAFRKQLNIKPSDVRRGTKGEDTALTLRLNYRPPLNWSAMLNFWAARTITPMEWVQGNCYGRTFTWPGSDARGWFEVNPIDNSHALSLRLWINQPTHLRKTVAAVRRLLDLDTDIATIEKHLGKHPGMRPLLTPGLRIPGIWHPFEAGVRAILGQQVSVAAARTHVTRLVEALGQEQNERRFFPSPETVASNKLAMLKIPQRRRETLRTFAEWYQQQGDTSSPDAWLAIKGIGPWTVDYAKLRGTGEPDIWLGSDLGIQKALTAIDPDFNSVTLSPWRSYATFHLWNSLS